MRPLTTRELSMLRHCIDAEDNGRVRLRAVAFRADVSTATAHDLMLDLLYTGCLAEHKITERCTLYSVTHWGRYQAGVPVCNGAAA